MPELHPAHVAQALWSSAACTAAQSLSTCPLSSATGVLGSSPDSSARCALTAAATACYQECEYTDFNGLRALTSCPPTANDPYGIQHLADAPAGGADRIDAHCARGQQGGMVRDAGKQRLQPLVIHLGEIAEHVSRHARLVTGVADAEAQATVGVADMGGDRPQAVVSAVSATFLALDHARG